ncbi:MAG: hypothetical protein ACOC85_00400 [Thermoplasmatota archaeon]
MSMRKEDRLFFLFAAFIAGINFSVPYLVLKNVTSYWANYLFWTVLTIFVIVIGYLLIRNWGEKE